MLKSAAGASFGQRACIAATVLGGASPVVSELSAEAALLSAVLSVVDVPLNSIAASSAGCASFVTSVEGFSRQSGLLSLQAREPHHSLMSHHDSCNNQRPSGLFIRITEVMHVPVRQ